jgi:hypothetical protein
VTKPWEEPGLSVIERGRRVWSEDGSELQADIIAALRAAARDAREQAILECEGVCRERAKEWQESERVEADRQDYRRAMTCSDCANAADDCAAAIAALAGRAG